MMLSELLRLGLKVWMRDSKPSSDEIAQLYTQDGWVTLKSGG